MNPLLPWFWRAVAVMFVLAAVVSAGVAVLLRPVGNAPEPRALPAGERVVVPPAGLGRQTVIVGVTGGRERFDVGEELGCTPYSDRGNAQPRINVWPMGVSSSDPAVTVAARDLEPLAEVRSRVHALRCSGPSATGAQPLYLVARPADLTPIRFVFGLFAPMALGLAGLALVFAGIGARRARRAGYGPGKGWS